MSSETSSSGHLVGYARVSTLEQDATFTDALQAAGCQRFFTETASGKLEHRPVLDAMLDQLRPGDTVAVWQLDRLGRSLRHLIDTVQALEAGGVAFRSLTESIDTSTPGGKLIFHVFGALAEFERDLIRERTMAGLAAARARGRSGGRPTVWTPEKLKVARSMYDSKEHDIAAIARVPAASFLRSGATAPRGRAHRVPGRCDSGRHERRPVGSRHSTGRRPSPAAPAGTCGTDRAGRRGSAVPAATRP